MKPDFGGAASDGVPAGMHASAAADEAARVLRESRERFTSEFATTWAAIASLAGGVEDEPASAAEAAALLHRMSGLGGTLGFHRVSARARALEDSLRDTTATPDTLRGGLDHMSSEFEQDLADGSVDHPMPVATPRGAALTVLLVEDEPVQRAMASAQLRQAGHTPVAVASGEEALDAARRSRPDVVLLDIELPGISGYEVCRRLKLDPALASIPVAFLSTHGAVDDRLTGLSYGAEDFLTKPMDPRELALRLQLLTKRHASPPDTAGDILSYEALREAAGAALARDRGVLALVRTPADRAPDVAALIRDEIRRRDLCGYYDRGHVAVFLPDTSGPSARERMATIVEKCRANGLSGVYAGLAAARTSGGRALDELVEEADRALAIARYEEQPAALCPEGPRDVPTGQARSPLVLVGDDDPDVVRIVDAHLAAAGYRRTLAFDGSRTLEEVRGQHPDVLVLDLMMPRMTGFDVLAGLRDMGETRPRIIVLSARGREEDVVRAFGLGADDFMAKPFNPQELLARIARLLR